MTRFIALAPLLLMGCGGPVTRAEAEGIAEDWSGAESDYRAAEIARLEARIEDLEEQIKGVRALGLENAENVKGIVAVFNKNVRIDNEAAVAAMTARGACGTRLVQPSPGIIRNEQIPCTLADLREAD